MDDEPLLTGEIHCFHAISRAAAHPEPRVSVHAGLEYGSQMVGASRGNPCFELPANFLGCRKIVHRIVELDLQELLDVALRAFNADLRPVCNVVFLPFCLLLQRIASLLLIKPLHLVRRFIEHVDYFFLSSPSTTSASITSPSPLPFASPSPPAASACPASPVGGGGAEGPPCCLYMASASL